jgi:hypothetical protein
VNAIRADGREHASASGNGYSLIAAFSDPHTLETVARKNGEVVGSTTYAVSVDGELLTISGDQQFIVLDRVT